MTTPVLQSGDYITEDYTVTDCIGIGGQAVVYRAQSVRKTRDLAIKILRLDQNVASIQTSIERFKQEAQLLKEMESPHTLTVHDFGELDDGALYMVVEYIDGVSLQEILADPHEHLSPQRIINVLKQTLLALQDAHHLGIVHRDIKPANIMLYADEFGEERIKLLDFGIAKLVLESKQLTNINTYVGTPKYIAPEMFKQDELSPAYDIYSLGLIAYQMIVGQHPLEGLGTRETLMSIARDPSHEIPDHVMTPALLRQITNQMLKKPLPERFHNAGQILQQLQEHHQSPTKNTSFVNSDVVKKILNQQSVEEQEALRIDAKDAYQAPNAAIFRKSSKTKTAPKKECNVRDSHSELEIHANQSDINHALTREASYEDVIDPRQSQQVTREGNIEAWLRGEQPIHATTERPIPSPSETTPKARDTQRVESPQIETNTTQDAIENQTALPTPTPSPQTETSSNTLQWIVIGIGIVFMMLTTILALLDII